MNKNKFFIKLIITLLFSLIAVNSYAKDVNVTIFHMNDIHAHIKYFAKVANIIKEEKKINENVYLFNIGDNFSGNPIVDQYDPRGEPLLILYKIMGFDIMALGNHEFDYGKKILRRFILKSSFRTLCANIVDKNKFFANISPYTILSTNEGIKIALLGMIQVDKDTGIPATHPKNVRDIEFKDEIETIKNFEYLKKKSDALIILSHMGIEKDVESAEKFSWIDLIIGGHSHTIIEDPKEFNGVLVTQAGSKGNYLGRIDLTFRDKSLISRKGSLIDLSKVMKEDEKIKSLVRGFNNNETMKKIITNLPFKLEGKRELGNMICDAIVDYLNIDAAFMNRGGIRIGQLKNKVSVKDIYTMHPFNNDLVVFSLTPGEIRALIEVSFMKGGKIDLFVGGFSYTVLKSITKKNRIEKIIIRDKNGNLLKEEKKYSVGINNYIASSYKFKREDSGKSANITLAEVVTEYLKKEKTYPNYKKIQRTGIKFFVNKDSKAIGSTKANIDNKGVGKGSCSAGNLITDSVKSELNVDIAFYPSRNINSGMKIKASEKIYEQIIPLLFKYSEKNKIITGNIKGKDIIDFLLKVVKYRNRVDLQVAGLAYVLKKNRSGKAVGVDCFIDGKKIDESKTYKTAFTDYDFEKFYKINDKVKDIKKSNRTVAQILKDYIVKIKVISKNIKKIRIKILEVN